MESKFVRKDSHQLWDPRSGTHPLEVSTDESLRASNRVITGIGIRMHDGDVTTLRVAYRKLDPDRGLLGPDHFQAAGTEPSFSMERWVFPLEAVGDRNAVLAGIGARAHTGNITTLRVWTRDILPNGRMAEPREHRFGPDPNHPLEALVMVPDPGVIIGWGLRANPGDVTHAMAWYGNLERNDQSAGASLFGQVSQITPFSVFTDSSFTNR